MSKKKTDAPKSEAQTEPKAKPSVPDDIAGVIHRAAKKYGVPEWVLRALYLSVSKRPPAQNNVTGLRERGKYPAFVSRTMAIDRAAVAVRQLCTDFSDAKAVARALAQRFPKATHDDYTQQQEK